MPSIALTGGGTAGHIMPNLALLPELYKYFDKIIEDSMFGEKSWELAESHFIQENMKLAVEKAGLKMKDMDYLLCGDLLNQCIASTFGILDFQVPFLRYQCFLVT
ncbi:MAG: hypothetical protein EOM23_07655 [Candidatus Moranbacteria bacterium]|nr:hypothetical protein [Candidatus Moranbacteria bacterium]